MHEQLIIILQFTVIQVAVSSEMYDFVNTPARGLLFEFLYLSTITVKLYIPLCSLQYGGESSMCSLQYGGESSMFSLQYGGESSMCSYSWDK